MACLPEQGLMTVPRIHPEMACLPDDHCPPSSVHSQGTPPIGENVSPIATLTPFVLRYVGDRLRRGEIKPVTARSIRNHLLDFALMWARRPVDQLSYKAAERWVEHMTAKGLAPGTQNAHLSSLRCFSRWCVRERIVTRDWMLEAPKVRRPRGIARDVNNDHFVRVLATARDTREALIVWIMFDAGARCVEVHRLNVEDVEREARQVFLTGKGGHQRYAPISDHTLRAMDAYLDDNGHHSGPLIRRHDNGQRLGPERISGLVGRMFRASGVKARPYDGRSAHGLRAAAATDLYEQCEDPRLVAEFLGHADLQSLSRYVRRGTMDQIRAAHSLREHVRRAS